jgi:hypothetical protein
MSSSILRRIRLPALGLAFAFVAVACSSGGGETPAADAGAQGQQQQDEVVAAVASYDVHVGEDRFIVGLFTGSNEFVVGGDATFQFSYIGNEQPEPGPVSPATFLALPGEDPDHLHDHAHAGAASEGRGIYAARVEFDRAGPWEVEVELKVEEETIAARAAFQVAEEPAVPDVGDEAPKTKNLTLDDIGEAPAEAVDSRAQNGEEVPDPGLHETTIAEAIRRGHPAVVAFDTPVFCQSRFCGPVNNMIEELSEEYGDRAEFIHVEIWRDFQNQVINKSAADWILRDDNLNEPWVFFIDGDGVIRARWDNVATRGEIEPFLEDLTKLS